MEKASTFKISIVMTDGKLIDEASITVMTDDMFELLDIFNLDSTKFLFITVGDVPTFINKNCIKEVIFI